MRYAIISDIHGNLEALNAVKQMVEHLNKQAKKEGGDPLHYWFLGDILGYGPDPIECLTWLRYSHGPGERWVCGNHDVGVVRMGAKEQGHSLPAKSAGTEEATSDEAMESWRRHVAVLHRPENSGWWEWFATQVMDMTGEEQYSKLTETHGEMGCTFVHGSVKKSSRRTQYLYPWSYFRQILQGDLEQVAEEDQGQHRTLCLFHGHTHYPALAVLESGQVRFRSIPYGQPIELGEGCMAINPGSVGQPRDGDPRAAFAVLDTVQRTITFHRVMYDVWTTMKKLEKGGYPPSLVHRLRTADGGADLAMYRGVYQVPEFHVLQAIE